MTAHKPELLWQGKCLDTGRLGRLVQTRQGTIAVEEGYTDSMGQISWRTTTTIDLEESPAVFSALIGLWVKVPRSP